MKKPDPLCDSWNQVSPRHSDESALSTALPRSTQGGGAPGKFSHALFPGVCLLLMISPGLYFLWVSFQNSWAMLPLVGGIGLTFSGSGLTWWIMRSP